MCRKSCGIDVVGALLSLLSLKNKNVVSVSKSVLCNVGKICALPGNASFVLRLTVLIFKINEKELSHISRSQRWVFSQKPRRCRSSNMQSILEAKLKARVSKIARTGFPGLLFLQIQIDYCLLALLQWDESLALCSQMFLTEGPVKGTSCWKDADIQLW